MKEKYIAKAKENYSGKSLELILKQIDLFYEKIKINVKKNYEVGELVHLPQGTYIHGIPGLLNNFNWIIENGFISTDFTNQSNNNKIKGSIGMWNIKNDCLLKDYIYNYSGFTITYTIGRGPNSATISEMIPYHQFDEYTERINNEDSIWMYWGEGTKETRFLPSLVANKRQIAFILNMNSEYAKKLVKSDIWNMELDKETLADFIDYRYLDKFMNERLNRDSITTERESAIIFGLPSKLIEGILVGRKVENNHKMLKHLKCKLPNCYVCNVDGKVIVK